MPIFPDGIKWGWHPDAIAKPNHPLGPCPKGLFWRLSVSLDEDYFRGQFIYKPQHWWEQRPIPKTAEEIKSLMPLVENRQGEFRWLFVYVSDVERMIQEKDSRIPPDYIEPFLKWISSDLFNQYIQECFTLIHAQTDGINLRPVLKSIRSFSCAMRFSFGRISKS